MFSLLPLSLCGSDISLPAGYSAQGNKLYYDWGECTNAATNANGPSASCTMLDGALEYARAYREQHGTGSCNADRQETHYALAYRVCKSMGHWSGGSAYIDYFALY